MPYVEIDNFRISGRVSQIEYVIKCPEYKLLLKRGIQPPATPDVSLPISKKEWLSTLRSWESNIKELALQSTPEQKPQLTPMSPSLSNITSSVSENSSAADDSGSGGFPSGHTTPRACFTLEHQAAHINHNSSPSLNNNGFLSSQYNSPGFNQQQSAINLDIHQQYTIAHNVFLQNVFSNNIQDNNNNNNNTNNNNINNTNNNNTALNMSMDVGVVPLLQLNSIDMNENKRDVGLGFNNHMASFLTPRECATQRKNSRENSNNNNVHNHNLSLKKREQKKSKVVENKNSHNNYTMKTKKEKKADEDIFDHSSVPVSLQFLYEEEEENETAIASDSFSGSKLLALLKKEKILN